MTKLENLLFAVQKAIAGLLMAVAFIGLVIAVPVRYFDLRLPDMSEASVAAIACLTFLCVGLLVRTGGHIAIEVSASLPGKRVRFAARQLANAGVLLFVVVFGKQAVDLLASALRSHEASIALHIPLAAPYTALIVGIVLAAFHTAMNVFRDIRALRSADAEFDEYLKEGEGA